MTLALIAAVGRNNVIGKQGDLPWHFPSDFKMFKERTTGHRVIMGRVTYDSILKRLGKPLPNRPHIILTRDQNFHDDRVAVIHDVKEIAPLIGNDETAFILGGAQIYQQTLPLADIVYLTHIDLAVEGADAFFPTLDPAVWHVSEESHIKENGTDLRFVTYRRINS